MDMTVVKMRGTAKKNEFQPHRRAHARNDFLSMDMTLVFKLQQLRRATGYLPLQERRYKLQLKQI
jgi:hypothetical protein